MKPAKSKWKITLCFLAALGFALAGLTTAAAKDKKGGGPPGGEAAGNCLSFPVIWSEGVAKVLRGTQGTVNLGGAWWYWWGTDAEDSPLSCAPDPDNQDCCDDGQVGTPDECDLEDVPGEGWIKVYLQQDLLNEWQAGSAAPTVHVEVNLIDWGDNLESVDWYTRSMVRTEVVLIQDLVDPMPPPMTQYGMRHLYGWGQTEMHGIAETAPGEEVPVEVLDGLQATVYSHCARLTIQKLLLQRDDPCLGYLEWVSEEGWTEPASYPEGVVCPDLINDPIFNKAVHEGGDGPGYYSAEINVKGKVIYGYTWNVRRENDTTQVPPYTKPTAAGDYRITFSLDATCGSVSLKTDFVEGITQILEPAEEEESLEEGESPTGGAVGVLDFDNDLTYMDVRILERGGKTK